MYDDYDKNPEETGEGTENIIEEEASGAAPESAETEETPVYAQEEASEEANEQPAEETAEEFESPAEEQRVQGEYEDIYSGTQETETEGEAPGAAQPQQEIPQAQAQRIPNQQGQYYGAGQQGGYSGYGNPSYGAPYGQGGPYSGPYGAQGRTNPYPNNGYYGAPQQPPVPPKKKNTGLKIFIAAIALVVVFAIIAGIVAVAGRIFSSRKTPSSSENHVTQQDDTEPGDDTALVIEETPKSSRAKSGEVLPVSEIAELGRASNVGILIYSSVTSASASGQGSGIVMGLDSTGKYTYIITCAHVIDDDGVMIKVQNEEGNTYDAEMVGYDKKTDIGVVKVKSTDFTPAVFGNSDELKVGDPVYAVGNPGGVEFFGSFTAGRISAIDRPISSEIGYTMKCIQHDAAINPGNSGGMLLNQYGQVIGINSQKIVTVSYEGMNFSIPITSAKVIIDDLIQYGYVKDRAKLSITYTSINNSTQYYLIAQVNNLPQGTLIITGINSDSSLVNTDAKKYDMIIAVNGEPLDTADALLEKIDEGKVGDKMTLTLCRVNSDYSVDRFDVTATLIEDKGNKEPAAAAEGDTETPTTAYNPFDYFFGYGY